VHPNVILAVVSLAGMAYSMLSSAVIPALPTIQHSLHTSETGVTWLLTGYLLSASVGTSILGRLGDIYGKERLLLVTLVVLAAGTLLAALAPSLGVLILARVIQGAGGGIFPLAFGIVRDEFPPERVAGSIGVVSSILGVGGGIGIVIGGLIVEHLSWHWLFWIPLATTLLAAVCTWRFIPESPVRSPGKVNWLAASLLSLGMCCVLIAIAQTTSRRSCSVPACMHRSSSSPSSLSCRSAPGSGSARRSSYQVCTCCRAHSSWGCSAPSQAASRGATAPSARSSSAPPSPQSRSAGSLSRTATRTTC
jgi:MFS family permease